VDLLSLPLRSAAETIGTPAMVVSEALLGAQVSAFKEAAQSLGAEVYYSVKTNDQPRLVERLAGWVAGLELISEAELDLAARLGVPGSRLILNGPNKSEAELAKALELTTALIHLDSFADLLRLERIAERLGVRAEVGVRIAFDPADTWSKFGLAAGGPELRALSARLREVPRLSLTAVHYHGEHQLEPDAGLSPLLRRIQAEVEALRRAGHPLTSVDLGGGWDPVIELGPDGRWHRDPRTARAFEEIGAHWSAWGSDAPRLILEPGRALTEAAVVGLTRVGNT
jgi:diaminopimelate decarboxylase